MIDSFGDRQQELLRLLLRKKEGLTIDQLRDQLKITRTAVNQHLTALEKSGYVVKGDFQETGGRPGRVFLLTDKGIDLFPKQYSWFSGLLLEALKKERGSEGLAKTLRDLAATISAGVAPRFEGKNSEEALHEMVKVLNELAYDATVARNRGAHELALEATNCVYHHLAAEHPEVCQFDLEILTRLMKMDVEHQSCIVRGGNSCRFRFTPKK